MKLPDQQEINQQLFKLVQQLIRVIVVLFVFNLVLILFLAYGIPKINLEKWFEDKPTPSSTASTSNDDIKSDPYAFWKAPAISTLEKDPNKDLILYGKELIANTAAYLGPKGKVAKISNGLNCQNCHLEAGTKPFGNNYSGVASSYPKYRARSGTVEDLYKRVNDCFERSLNGTALDTSSREMQAIKSYIEWLGKDVPKGTKPNGVGLAELAFLSRPADAEKGAQVYKTHCVSCHQANGEGVWNEEKTAFVYPALWGPNAYNSGAGLYRLSRFASYVKYNMPFGVSYTNPVLTDEEAWDVAAYVNSQKRPSIDISKDWPKIIEKPVDHPFGPFADGFSEKQHKLGPFDPIQKEIKKLKEKQKKES